MYLAKNVKIYLVYQSMQVACQKTIHPNFYIEKKTDYIHFLLRSIFLNFDFLLIHNY
jgi:hypothetical protein